MTEMDIQEETRMALRLARKRTRLCPCPLKRDQAFLEAKVKGLDCFGLPPAESSDQTWVGTLWLAPLVWTCPDVMVSSSSTPEGGCAAMGDCGERKTLQQRSLSLLSSFPARGEAEDVTGGNTPCFITVDIAWPIQMPRKTANSRSGAVPQRKR